MNINFIWLVLLACNLIACGVLTLLKASSDL